MTDPFTKNVYCTACSVQTGNNKKKVTHENIEITAASLKPTKKKAKEGETNQKIVGYVAVLKCPVTGRNISVFVEKSKARALLGISTDAEEVARFGKAPAVIMEDQEEPEPTPNPTPKPPASKSKRTPKPAPKDVHSESAPQPADPVPSRKRKSATPPSH